MAGDIEFELTGYDEAIAKLGALKQSVKSKLARSALRKAGLIIVKAAQANVAQYDDPETARSIAKNLAIQWNNKRFRATGDIAFRIGVRGGAVVPKGKAIPDGVKAATPHWRFIEFGTKSSIAKPFLRPAMSSNVQAVTDSFAAELNKVIDKAIRTGRAE